MRPTDRAHQNFLGAKTTSSMAVNESNSSNLSMYDNLMAQPLGAIVDGLDDMATGMRATYILLEQIKDQLEKQRLGRP